jgi:hypothetical protein
MRRNEPKRLARRAQHPKSRVQSQKFIGKTKNGKPFTQAHAEDFENEVKIALHESSHIMAAWMLGQPIGGMQFNDGTGTSGAWTRNAKEGPETETVNGIRVQKYPDEVPHFYAETVIGYPLPDLQAKSIGERLVHAKEHAFISLAGVFGCSNEAWSDNPLSEFETKSHLSEAGAKFVLIAGVSQPEAGNECAPLVLHVKRTFDDKRVQAATHALAKQFLKRRKLTGEEATAIIEQAWKQANEEHGKATNLVVR